MAGLDVISALLLNELHEATAEPPAAILQRLAILAERQRGTPPPLRPSRRPGPANTASRRRQLTASPT